MDARRDNQINPPSPGGQDQLVSIVMRTVGGRPREIRRAIASVAANTWKPVEILIVYQGIDATEWQAIEALPSEFPGLAIRAVQNKGDGDRRAENLNIGWEAGAGRYLGFLDDDDSLSPEHLALLVSAMEASGRAWACGQVTLRKEDDSLAVVNETRPFRRHRFSVVDLWTENFIPIHSMLIDRMRLAVPLRHRPFCELLDRSEDWDFLIRLAFYHEPAIIDDFTCTYHVSTGARNTNLSLMDVANEERQERNRQAWARCKALVEQRKAELLAPLWWAREQFAELAPPETSSNASQETAQMASAGRISVTRPALSFRRRAVRKVIRILERML